MKQQNSLAKLNLSVWDSSVNLMKKQLTIQQFDAIARRLGVSQQTLEIARGVLVEGLSQSTFVEKFGVSKGAVSQAVNRIWDAHIPIGYEKLTVVLPTEQAKVVKEWAEQAQIQLGKI